MNPKNNIIETKVKNLLAEYLGVNPEDIDNEDSFESDMHISHSDFSDFIRLLAENGFNTTNLDITEIDTFSELVDNLESNESLE